MDPWIFDCTSSNSLGSVALPRHGGGARDGGGQQHFHQREDDHHKVQPVQCEREESQAVDQPTLAESFKGVSGTTAFSKISKKQRNASETQPQKQLQKEEAGENRVQDVQDAFCTWRRSKASHGTRKNQFHRWRAWPQVGSFFGLARIANGEADVQASVLPELVGKVCRVEKASFCDANLSHSLQKVDEIVLWSPWFGLRESWWFSQAPHWIYIVCDSRSQTHGNGNEPSTSSCQLVSGT